MTERFRTIVADPPWRQPSGGPRTGWMSGGVPGTLPYPTMEIDEIAALPVGEMAAGDAHLYVWTTNAMLEATYRVVRAWGFRPSQMLVWAKQPRGLGPGGAFANTTEFIAFARRGSLRPLRRHDSTWFDWRRPRTGGLSADTTRRTHSRKPEAFLDLVEQVSPGPYLELFARRARLGWERWGNEVSCTVTLPVREVPSEGAGS